MTSSQSCSQPVCSRSKPSDTTVLSDFQSQPTRKRASAKQKDSQSSETRSCVSKKDTTLWNDDLVSQLLEIRKMVVPDPNCKVAPYGSWKRIHQIWKERKLPNMTEQQLRQKWTQLNRKKNVDKLVNQTEEMNSEVHNLDENEKIRMSDLYKKLEPLIIDPNNFTLPIESRTSTRMKRIPSSSDLKVLNLLFSDLYPRIENLFHDKLLAIDTLLYTIVHKYKSIKEPMQQAIYDKKEQDLINAIKNITRKLRPLYAAMHRMRNGVKETSQKIVQQIVEEYKTFDLKSLTTKIGMMKQERNRYKRILSEYKKRKKFFRTNEMFMVNEKKFYSMIENRNKTKRETPDEKEVVQFWSSIWERKRSCNLDAAWIKEISKKLEEKLSLVDKENTRNSRKLKTKTANNLKQVNSIFNLNISHIFKSIHKKKNWSAPGPDMICNYWWKYIDSTWPKLLEAFQQMLNNTVPIPEWFCAGVTYRIPKQGPPCEANIRPITCLNTVYKMFTSIVLSYLSEYLDQHNLMTIEQRGAKKGVWGTYENLLIDEIISQDANKHRNKSFSAAWLDITKAYDSIPHEWIMKCLEIHKVPNEIKAVIRQLMEKWSTRIYYDFQKKTRTIQIKNGIFQGDSLCPFLFCLALNPISILIKSWNCGYKLNSADMVITHSMFIDDIKLYSTTQDKMNGILSLLKSALSDIGLSINDKKSGTLIRCKGMISEQGVKLQDGTSFPAITKTNLYRYLGFMQSLGIDKEKNKEMVINEFKERVERLVNSSLSGFHLARAYNTYCIGYLRYFFFMKWNYYELNRMEQILKKSLKQKGLFFRGFPVALFHLPRDKGGRGFQSVFMEYLIYRIGLAFKFHKSPHMERITNLLRDKDCDSFYNDTLTYGKEFGLQFEFQKNQNIIIKDSETKEELNISSKKKLTQLLRDRANKKWLTEAEEGGMHFKFWNMYKERLSWIKNWRFITKQCENMLWMAMTANLQTRSLTKWYNTQHSNGLKQQNNIKCRLCGKANETTEHIVSGCSALMNSDIIPRHNSVLYHLLRMILDRNGIQHNGTVQTEYSTDKVRIQCNCKILTIREVEHNVPDLVVYLHERKQIQIIDIAVPYDDNLEMRYNEKIQKYGPLQIELQKLNPGYKATVIPIVIGAFGVTLPSFQENLKKVLGENCLYEAKKLIRAAISGTFLILTKWESRAKIVD